MTPRSVWARLDPFSEDDPAVRLLRDAHELQPPSEEGPQPAQNGPGAAIPTRRDLIGALVVRVRSGDLAALAELRRLLP